MALVWLIAAFAFPYVIGKGVLLAVYGKNKYPQESDTSLTGADGLIAGWLVCIGIGEAVHLAGIILGKPLSALVRWDIVLTVAAAAAAAVLGKLRINGGLILKREKFLGTETEVFPYWRSGRYACLTAIFLLTAVLTLVSVATSAAVYTDADMTAETVESFRTTDALYSVNPMTGQAYRDGLPSRLKILCLPTLYAIACEVTGLETTELVWHWIPALVLIGSLVVYGILARCLFPDRETDGREQRERAAVWRAAFLLFVVVVFWLGNYGEGLDGFDLISGGFRAVTIRSTILVPYMIACVLRRRYLPAVLCAAAEVCIMWTLYGLGALTVVAVGMWLTGRRKVRSRTEGEAC